MKKIAFISNGHSGSSMPLAKQFLFQGYAVDYYILTEREVSSLEAVKIESFKTNYGVHKIDSTKAEDLYSYMASKHFNLYCLSTPRPFERVPFLRNILKNIRKYFFKNICSELNNREYYAINLIGRQDSKMFIWFYKYLNCRSIITSLHEVCNHNNPDFKNPSELLNYLFAHKKEIVVHSQKSKADILSFNNVNEKYIHHINFGLFESYLKITPKNIDNLPQKYILFYGSINPYKGLSVLYNAIYYNPEFFHDVKFVVAGKGSDPVLERIKSDDKFFLINHFLSNEELVELIQKAHFVVCPYITVSQSGIPQTTFVFNKPIIASNIGSFQEIITHGVNGYLFNAGDMYDLSNLMNDMINDQEKYKEITENIRNFENLHPSYSWDYISSKYEAIFVDN